LEEIKKYDTESWVVPSCFKFCLLFQIYIWIHNSFKRR
jgi:hypothetical protein